MSADAVVFVLPDFNGGGAEQAVLRIVCAWPADLPAPTVAVKATTGPLAELFRDAGVHVVDLGGGRRHSAMSSARSTWALRRLVGRTRPAAVVAVLSAPFVVAACRSRPRRPRVVVSVQNPVLAEGSSTARRIVATATLRMADAVLPISPGIGDELRSQGVAPDRITVVPNPVDTAAFSPAEGEREKSVVMLARLARQKRVDIALRAFAAAGLDGWRLDIHGTGEEQPGLEALAGELGVAGAILLSTILLL